MVFKRHKNKEYKACFTHLIEWLDMKIISLLILVMLTGQIFAEDLTDEDIKNKFKEALLPPPLVKESRRQNLSVNDSIYKALCERKNLLLWINYDNIILEEKFPSSLQCSCTSYGITKDSRLIIGRYESGILRRIDLKTTTTYEEITDYLEGRKTPSYVVNLEYIK